MTTNYCGSTSYLLHIYIISQGRRLTPTGLNVFLQQSGWRDSNPHALRHQILSLVCLPVPAHPGSQGFTLLNLGGAEWSWTTAYGFSVHCTITTYTTAPKFSSIIYCLLWACIISTSLNPYFHLTLSFSRNHYQVLFRSIWSVGWIFLHSFALGTGFEPVSHAWKTHRLDH